MKLKRQTKETMERRPRLWLYIWAGQACRVSGPRRQGLGTWGAHGRDGHGHTIRRPARRRPGVGTGARVGLRSQGDEGVGERRRGVQRSGTGVPGSTMDIICRSAGRSPLHQSTKYETRGLWTWPSQVSAAATAVSGRIAAGERAEAEGNAGRRCGSQRRRLPRGPLSAGPAGQSELALREDQTS